jgi:hypothetical protein
VAHQHGEEEVVVDAGVIALHDGAEDERVGGEVLVHEPDGGFRPAPPWQVVAVLGEVRQPVGGEDQGGRLEHQGIQRRPDLDGLVAVVDAADRAEAILARPQLGLELGADHLPPPADIPHVVVGRIVLAAFTQPGIRLLQDGLGCNHVHPVHGSRPRPRSR